MESPILSPDAATRSTDTDALISRISSAKLNYNQDKFSIQFQSKKNSNSNSNSIVVRPALINLGTHARTWSVDYLVEQFLDAKIEGGERKQILSLGAGSDSRFWRMKERYLNKGKGKEGESQVTSGEKGEWNCRWVEVDFVEATSSKTRTVWSKPSLKSLLSEGATLEKGGVGISSPDYYLLPGDLRTFSSTLGEELLSGPNPILDPTLPTLLLAECVLIYLPPETNSEILSWFTNHFKKGSTISYDPFGLQDNFGKVMIRNLATRNLTLPSVDSTPTIVSLNQRLLSAGFHSAQSLSIKKIRESVIPAEEILRVAKIEMLDEVEELNLVLDHYAITWGVMSEGISIGFVTR